jgi:hypothetical protein
LTVLTHGCRDRFIEQGQIETAITTKFCHQRRTRSHPDIRSRRFYSFARFALKENKVKRYRHAARHLAECASLAVAVGDFGNFEPHKRYSTRPKADYGRKTSFWALTS